MRKIPWLFLFLQVKIKKKKVNLTISLLSRCYLLLSELFMLFIATFFISPPNHPWEFSVKTDRPLRKQVKSGIILPESKFHGTLNLSTLRGLTSSPQKHRILKYRYRIREQLFVSSHPNKEWSVVPALAKKRLDNNIRDISMHAIWLVSCCCTNSSCCTGRNVPDKSGGNMVFSSCEDMISWLVNKVYFDSGVY